MLKKVFLFALLVALLSACQANRPEVVAAPTAAETAAPVVTTESASPTPLPATATKVAPTLPPTATNTPAPISVGPDSYPQNVNPLTGLQVSDPALLNRRPMAVKIQLFPRQQRPPMGISQADLVFDYYQNNGLTRLHAIFYGSEAEQIGPVRSARFLDDSLIRMYKSLFAFGGADERIASRLFNAEYANRLIVEGSQNCPPMCRLDPNGSNLLVTNTKDMTTWATNKKVDNQRQNLNGMLFKQEIPTGGTPIDLIYTHYSISSYNYWDYDPQTGSYLRFQDTQETSGNAGEAFEPLVDKQTNAQISAQNVVVLMVEHSYFYQSQSKTSEIIEYALNGTGKAYAFRDGQFYEVAWNRKAADSVLTLTTKDGQPFAFKPGNTWFEVMGTSSAVKPQEGQYRFEFSIP